MPLEPALAQASEARELTMKKRRLFAMANSPVEHRVIVFRSFRLNNYV